MPTLLSVTEILWNYFAISFTEGLLLARSYETLDVLISFGQRQTAFSFSLHEL